MVEKTEKEPEETFPLEGESKDRRKFFLEKNLLFEQRQTKTIQAPCMGCKSVTPITVGRAGFSKWMRGTPIQDALPDVPPEQRELLISQVCQKCWKKMFGRTCGA